MQHATCELCLKKKVPLQKTTKTKNNIFLKKSYFLRYYHLYETKSKKEEENRRKKKLEEAEETRFLVFSFKKGGRVTG